MQSKHINPFLESSIFVIEQMCSIRPQLGELQLRTIEVEDGPVWLMIRVFGDMEGQIIYRFDLHVALKLVSGMMGGFVVTELDEIGKSAIFELGNMISGNAGSILSGQGIEIDISPPAPATQSDLAEQALSIPLLLDGIGEFHIFVNVKNQQAG